MNQQENKGTKMGKTRLIYVGIGGNVGDVPSTFKRGLEHLQANGLTLLQISPIYKTEPIGGIVQADFLNAVAEIQTTLDPKNVHEIMQATEKNFGRNRELEIRWGPRTIDLDYLLDSLFTSINTDSLTLPHPRMWERAFVVAPLADLIPEMLSPEGVPIKYLAHQLAQVQGLSLYQGA
jgi:2-amino-4-hydroxy-6-hydroxymethyldihydropteridine diphosphokinase